MAIRKLSGKHGTQRKLFCFCSILMFFLSVVISSSLDAGVRLTARAGELDASGWDPQEVYTLHGEWHFVGQELLKPDSFLRMQREGRRFPTTQLGRSLDESAPDLIKGPKGYGTYILRLKNLPPGALFAMSEMVAYVSARIYVFDSEGRGGEAPLYELGYVTDDPSKAKSALSLPHPVPFVTPSAGDCYILIQVGNHVHAWGGLWIPPKIGPAGPILAGAESSMKYSAVAFGVMLFIGFYNAIFFIYRPKNKGSLNLAFIAVILLARTWTFNHYGHDFFGDGYWGLQISFKITYMTLFAIPWAFYNSVRGFFPRHAPSWMNEAMRVISIAGILFVLLTPSDIFCAVGNQIFITGISLGLCTGYVTIRAARARESGASTLLFGISCIVIASIVELLNALNLFQYGRNGMTYGMAIFAACQSQILSKQFAEALNQSEHLSSKLHSEVQKQTRDIRSLLDNLHQGIFTLVAGTQKIGSLFSAHLRHITGQDEIEGSSLRQLLLDRSQLNSDAKDRVEAVIDASLGEDRIAFELNSPNLVDELSFQHPQTGRTQYLELDWVPMHDSRDQVEQILISVRDVTEIRNLKKKAREREEDFEVLQELVDVAEDRFIRFMHQAMGYLHDNHLIIASPYDDQSVQRLFINMHTLKGIARSYHFSHLAHVVHLAEENLHEIRKNRQAWDPETLEHDRQTVEAVCFHYRNIAREKLGWTTSDSTLRLKKPRIENMIQYIQRAGRATTREEAQRQLAALEKELLELRYHPFTLVVDEAFRGLDSLARSIEKLPPLLEVKARDIILQEKSATALHGVFTHLMRNSIDHGLEIPQERVRAGKTEQGTMRIQAEIHNEELVIHYEDDGRGLNLAEISKRAGPNHNLASDAERAELIFLPGLSTKNQATDLSGRGVGMDAVRSILQSLGGNIQIELSSQIDSDRRNFRLILTLPASCLVQSTLDDREDIHSRNSSGF